MRRGAFSSTTTDLKASRGFTNKAKGVIFKLEVWTGRSINNYSFFPARRATGTAYMTPRPAHLMHNLRKT